MTTRADTTPDPAAAVPATRLATAQDTRDFGQSLAARLRAGDLVILTGDLGAGKTTLTQGLAEGLGVRGPITSPTFVIARVHPSLTEGPALVHVDAYRIGGLDELDGLDLETSLEDSVTVVEWGHGVVEGLTDDRLQVVLAADPATEERTVQVLGHGARWAGESGGEPC